MSQDRQKTYADKSRRPSPNYKVNDLRSPHYLVVASCDKRDEPLGVYHTSVFLTPFSEWHRDPVSCSTSQEKRKATQTAIGS
ncbi:hypothetical protein TNCV_475991 [Trichonephila clavipes]|nr:hypothetical protein TNCV_475991 [Trichonephila clavipes]